MTAIAKPQCDTHASFAPDVATLPTIVDLRSLLCSLPRAQPFARPAVSAGSGAMRPGVPVSALWLASGRAATAASAPAGTPSSPPTASTRRWISPAAAHSLARAAASRSASSRTGPGPNPSCASAHPPGAIAPRDGGDPVQLTSSLLLHHGRDGLQIVAYPIGDPGRQSSSPP